MIKWSITKEISGGTKMGLFEERIEAFFSEFGKGRKMVLSTAENDRVSSRMMSVVQINGEFLFQTDRNLKKYHQLSTNPNVALCIDNIQIEGTCREIGHPLDNPVFCSVYQDCFKGSFDAYSSLKNERLFSVKPCYIERWIYKDGLPYIETFCFEHNKYCFEKYIAV